MLTVISPYADVSVQMLVASCRYILVFNIRGVGRERFIYLKRGKKEMRTSCKNPLPMPQFTFYERNEGMEKERREGIKHTCKSL